MSSNSDHAYLSRARSSITIINLGLEIEIKIEMSKNENVRIIFFSVVHEKGSITYSTFREGR